MLLESKLIVPNSRSALNASQVNFEQLHEMRIVSLSDCDKRQSALQVATQALQWLGICCVWI